MKLKDWGQSSGLQGNLKNLCESIHNNDLKKWLIRMQPPTDVMFTYNIFSISELKIVYTFNTIQKRILWKFGGS